MLSIVVAFHRILAATDFSECSDAAVEHAVYVAERFAAELHLMHVVEGDDDPSPYWFVPGEPIGNEPADAYRRTDAGRKLMSLVAHHAARLSTVTRGRLQFGDPAKTIIRAAEVDGYDLIVMGTHGRSGLSHLLVGSVAETVVRHSPCPVLMVCSKHRTAV